MRLQAVILALWTVVVVEAVLLLTVASWKNVVTGVPFQITWTGNNGSISVTLQNGTTSNPVDVNEIEAAVTSNSYDWTPGRFAIVGHTFFIGIEDEGGDKAIGSSFVVHASSSTTSGASTSATATSSTVSATTTSSPASTTSAVSATTSAASAATTSSGLSSGAKVGLGVGIGLGVVLVAAAAVFLAMKRRKRNRDAPVENHYANETPVMGNTHNGPPGYTDAKEGYKPVEMSVQPPELDSQHPAPRHELA